MARSREENAPERSTVGRRRHRGRALETPKSSFVSRSRLFLSHTLGLDRLALRARPEGEARPKGEGQVDRRETAKTVFPVSPFGLDRRERLELFRARGGECSTSPSRLIKLERLALRAQPFFTSPFSRLFLSPQRGSSVSFQSTFPLAPKLSSLSLRWRE